MERKKGRPRKEDTPKVLFSIDENKFESLHQRISEFCKCANDVRCISKQFDIDPSLEDVFSFVNDFEKLKDAVCRKQLDIYATNNPYLQGYIETQVKANLLKWYPENKRPKVKDIISLDELCYIAEDNDQYVPNEKSITENCKIFAQGKSLELWEHLQIAVKHLNLAFNGKQWKFGNNWSALIFQNNAQDQIEIRKDFDINKLAETLCK